MVVVRPASPSDVPLFHPSEGSCLIERGTRRLFDGTVDDGIPRWLMVPGLGGYPRVSISRSPRPNSTREVIRGCYRAVARDTAAHRTSLRRVTDINLASARLAPTVTCSEPTGKRARLDYCSFIALAPALMMRQKDMIASLPLTDRVRSQRWDVDGVVSSPQLPEDSNHIFLTS